jgi:hypothetical protein
MWTFGLPTRVTFGVGASGSAPEVAGSYGGRPIIVTAATLAELPRVHGYSAYFVDLSPDLQNDIIARTQHDTV